VTGESPLDSSVTATIDLSSINTSNEDRDNHIRSADFFEVDQQWTFALLPLTGDGSGDVGPGLRGGGYGFDEAVEDFVGLRFG
jgi:hypothetical protein